MTDRCSNHSHGKHRMNNTPDSPGFCDAHSVRYWLFVATIYAVGIVAGLLAVQ